MSECGAALYPSLHMLDELGGPAITQPPPPDGLQGLQAAADHFLMVGGGAGHFQSPPPPHHQHHHSNPHNHNHSHSHGHHHNNAHSRSGAAMHHHGIHTHIHHHQSDQQQPGGAPRRAVSRESHQEPSSPRAAHHLVHNTLNNSHNTHSHSNSHPHSPSNAANSHPCAAHHPYTFGGSADQELGLEPPGGGSGSNGSGSGDLHLMHHRSTGPLPSPRQHQLHPEHQQQQHLQHQQQQHNSPRSGQEQQHSTPHHFLPPQPRSIDGSFPPLPSVSQQQQQQQQHIQQYPQHPQHPQPQQQSPSPPPPSNHHRSPPHCMTIGITGGITPGVTAGMLATTANTTPMDASPVPQGGPGSPTPTGVAPAAAATDDADPVVDGSDDPLHLYSAAGVPREAGNTTSASSQPAPIVIHDRWRVHRRIGSGSFGDIYSGVDLVTNEVVAIKVERLNAKFPQLQDEYTVYTRVTPHFGYPKARWFGRLGNCQILVMDLLGDTLEQLFNICGRRFSLKTTLMLAIQLVGLIEHQHANHYLHRDIKPDNFMLGLNSKSSIVHIIDMGLCKRYRDPVTGAHIPYGENRKLIGTPRYASLNTHLGLEQGRRDDLESIGYMLVYFLRGKLPWQGLRARDKHKKYEKIEQKKAAISVQKLTESLPPQFTQYMEYCRQLAFDAEPDYQYLKCLFGQLFLDKGYSDDGIYDWSHLQLQHSQQQQQLLLQQQQLHGGPLAGPPVPVPVKVGFPGLLARVLWPNAPPIAPIRETLLSPLPPPGQQGVANRKSALLAARLRSLIDSRLQESGGHPSHPHSNPNSHSNHNNQAAVSASSISSSTTAAAVAAAAAVSPRGVRRLPLHQQPPLQPQPPQQLPLPPCASLELPSSLPDNNFVIALSSPSPAPPAPVVAAPGVTAAAVVAAAPTVPADPLMLEMPAPPARHRSSPPQLAGYAQPSQGAGPLPMPPPPAPMSGHPGAAPHGLPANLSAAPAAPNPQQIVASLQAQLMQALARASELEHAFAASEHDRAELQLRCETLQQNNAILREWVERARDELFALYGHVELHSLQPYVGDAALMDAVRGSAARSAPAVSGSGTGAGVGASTGATAAAAAAAAAGAHSQHHSHSQAQHHVSQQATHHHHMANQHTPHHQTPRTHGHTPHHTSHTHSPTSGYPSPASAMAIVEEEDPPAASLEQQHHHHPNHSHHPQHSHLSHGVHHPHHRHRRRGASAGEASSGSAMALQEDSDGGAIAAGASPLMPAGCRGSPAGANKAAVSAVSGVSAVSAASPANTINAISDDSSHVTTAAAAASDECASPSATAATATATASSTGTGRPRRTMSGRRRPRPGSSSSAAAAAAAEAGDDEAELPLRQSKRARERIAVRD